MEHVFSVIGLTLVLTALLLVFSADARRITVVGVAVGTILGFWIVAPLALSSHHLEPQTLKHWQIVLAFLACVFGGWSLVMAAVASWPLAIWRFIRPQSQPMSSLSAALWTAVSIPILYVTISVGIELSVFSRLVSSSELRQFLGMIAGAATLAALLHVWVVRSGRRVGGITVAVLLFLALIGGVSTLVLRSSHNRTAHPTDVPPLRLRTLNASASPLLFIGLDGGSWQLLRPMIDQGRAPTFARLAAGMQGSVQALWPPYWSVPAWGAILTGYGIDELGVHEDLAAHVDGLPLFELPLSLSLAQNPLYLIELALIRADVIEPSPTPRNALRRPPVWERLSKAGVKTAVVRFPFTYPAANQADIVVSNRVVTDLWDLMGVELGRREDLVSTAGDPESLLAWFDERFVVDESALDRILPPGGWPKPADAVLDPSEVTKKIFSIGQRMFSITEHLIREHRDLDVVMLHITDLDNISHAFWAYRFPEEFPNATPAHSDIAALGPVADRYVEYLDRKVAALIAAFPTPPNVIVVSDHGQAAAAASTMSLWKGWHSSPGVFMAAGPNIPRLGELNASYFDIVPTLLDALNVEPAPDLTGRSLLPAVSTSLTPSYGAVARGAK